jgi:aminoglycoside 3-N-acetyltransferase
MTWSPMSMPGPFTTTSLAEDLRALGVTEGSTLLVHSSLSALGYVVGGAQAVVLALFDVLGPTGTLVVPTHSGDLSEPSYWQNPPAPKDAWTTIRQHLPAFDPHLTATSGMGIIPDTVRAHPRALRSNHPSMSFAAVGPHAEVITANHGLDFGFDEHSPLARLEELGATVLLLGVDHDRNTSLHLAEYRVHEPDQEIEQGAPLMVDGARQWVTFTTLDYNTEDFCTIGQALSAAGHQRMGTVGAGTARLFDLATVVAFATTWFDNHRPPHAQTAREDGQ